MVAKPMSLRIPWQTRDAIEDIMRRTGRDFSSVANEMLTEAVKMRRIPGIAFADSPGGRVACIAGTNSKVFAVAAAFRTMDGDFARLQRAYHWLSEHQLRSALAYAEAYPEEIADRLREEEHWTPETAWATYPFMRPRER